MFEDGQQLSLIRNAKVHEGYPLRNTNKPLAVAVKVSCKGKRLWWRIKTEQLVVDLMDIIVSQREVAQKLPFTKQWKGGGTHSK